MSRHTRTYPCLFALTLTVAACGDGGSGPIGPEPNPVNGTVSLTNNANTPIVEVNISACTDTSWGSNRLEGSQAIAPGGNRTWSVPAGCYDIRAMTASKAGSWWDRTVSAGNVLQLALSSAANEIALSTHKIR